MTRDMLVSFAVLHGKRLELLPAGLDERALAEEYGISVWPMYCHPEGSWRVSLWGPERSGKVSIVVTSRGTLVGFEITKSDVPGADDAEAEGDPESIEAALSRAKSFVEGVRGYFPEDVQLVGKTLIRVGDRSRVEPSRFRKPYWEFSWYLHDQGLRYQFSFIRVVVSKKDGVVLYTDQYLPLRTKHEVKLTPRDAEEATRKHYTEDVLPLLPAKSRVRSVAAARRPIVYVWQVPGYSGDTILYTVGFRIYVPGARYTDLQAAYVDAETGTPVAGMPLSPYSWWRVNGRPWDGR